MEVVRELDEADVEMLLAARDRGNVLPSAEPIKRLRETHHALAKAIADGLSQTDAAIRTGYSISRVSILMGDPTFQELVEHYRENRALAYRDMHQAMADLGLDALQELHARLEETPEELSNQLLHDIAKTFADRTGYAPVAKSVNVNVDIAGRLAAARKRARLESDET